MDLFLGRFSPFHNGHKRIIEMMEDPVVVLVKGVKSSMDKKTNPFSTELQIQMINDVFPDLPISVSPNGFLPGIILYLKEKRNMEINRIFCGSDRMESYSTALLKGSIKNVKLVETLRIMSGTQVREAIREDKYDLFCQMVPKELWLYYDVLKEDINVGYSNT